MTFKSPEEIQELIENGNRLVLEAQAVLAKNDRILRQHNIDPTQTMEFVRQRGGEAAVQAVEEQVKQIMRQIEETVEQQRAHAVKPRNPGTRPRPRRNMI